MPESHRTGSAGTKSYYSTGLIIHLDLAVHPRKQEGVSTDLIVSKVILNI